MDDGTNISHHWISGLEGGAGRLERLVTRARSIEDDLDRIVAERPLAGRVLAALFVNPSLRTRTSMEAAMAKLGGHMVALEPGAGSWGLAFGDRDAVMDGAAAEHIVEAAGVLSSYGDAVALRAFAPMLGNFDEEMRDEPIRALAEHASVPVVSMESAVYHPCQALADAVTLHEIFDGAPAGRHFTLTWATHPKCCGVAVPHSALLTAARLGMHVRLAHPPGYELHEPIVAEAESLAARTGGSLQVEHDRLSACEGADVIYAKAWGAREDWGRPEAGARRNAQHGDWTVGPEEMSRGRDARLMHCLPVRRNVVVRSEVLDGPTSVVQRQAANRLWAQMALLLDIFGEDIGEPGA